MPGCCPICFESFENKIRASPNVCNHIFCLVCLQTWSKLDNICPIDRKKFKKIRNLDSASAIPIKPPKRRPKRVFYDVTSYCEVCKIANNGDTLVMCDTCDLGFHCNCLTPPLSVIPNRQWHCPECVAIDLRLRPNRSTTTDRTVSIKYTKKRRTGKRGTYRKTKLVSTRRDAHSTKISIHYSQQQHNHRDAASTSFGDIGNGIQMEGSKNNVFESHYDQAGPSTSTASAGNVSFFMDDDDFDIRDSEFESSSDSDEIGDVMEDFYEQESSAEIEGVHEDFYEEQMITEMSEGEGSSHIIKEEDEFQDFGEDEEDTSNVDLWPLLPVSSEACSSATSQKLDAESGDSFDGDSFFLDINFDSSSTDNSESEQQETTKPEEKPSTDNSEREQQKTIIPEEKPSTDNSEREQQKTTIILEEKPINSGFKAATDGIYRVCPEEMENETVCHKTPEKTPNDPPTETHNDPPTETHNDPPTDGLSSTFLKDDFMMISLNLNRTFVSDKNLCCGKNVDAIDKAKQTEKSLHNEQSIPPINNQNVPSYEKEFMENNFPRSLKGARNLKRKCDITYPSLCDNSLMEVNLNQTISNDKNLSSEKNNDFLESEDSLHAKTDLSINNLNLPSSSKNFKNSRLAKEKKSILPCSILSSEENQITENFHAKENQKTINNFNSSSYFETFRKITEKAKNMLKSRSPYFEDCYNQNEAEMQVKSETFEVLEPDVIPNSCNTTNSPTKNDVYDPEMFNNSPSEIFENKMDVTDKTNKKFTLEDVDSCNTISSESNDSKVGCYSSTVENNISTETNNKIGRHCDISFTENIQTIIDRENLKEQLYAKDQNQIENVLSYTSSESIEKDPTFSSGSLESYSMLKFKNSRLCHSQQGNTENDFSSSSDSHEAIVLKLPLRLSFKRSPMKLDKDFSNDASTSAIVNNISASICKIASVTSLKQLDDSLHPQDSIADENFVENDTNNNINVTSIPITFSLVEEQNTFEPLPTGNAGSLYSNDSVQNGSFKTHSWSNFYYSHGSSLAVNTSASEELLIQSNDMQVKPPSVPSPAKNLIKTDYTLNMEKSGNLTLPSNVSHLFGKRIFIKDIKQLSVKEDGALFLNWKQSHL